MNWVDLTVVGILVVSAVIGRMRGFIKESLSLVGWIASFWVALTFSSDAARLLIDYIDASSVRLLTAFTGLLIFTLLLSALVRHFVIMAFNRAGLIDVDHSLGIAFGLLRGVAITALLVFVVEKTPVIDGSAWQNSLSVEYIEPLVSWLRDIVPAEFVRYVQPDS